MSSRLDILLRAAANEVGIPADFANAVLAECPWLDGTEEVNESFGLELLGQRAANAGVSAEQVERFLYACNRRVREINPR